jgi:protein involved in polysaccharide export with SLBB domain
MLPLPTPHSYVLLLALATALECVAGSPVAAQAAPVKAAPDDSLRIRPGDVVRLKIWREPDLSGDFAVGEDQVVTLPKLGPIPVAEQSVSTLPRLLVGRYGEFLVNPSIEVVVLRRVNVQGAVRNPGIYMVDPTATLADALALAGGLTSDGRAKEVQLVRQGAKLASANVTGETKLGATPIRSGDQIYVPQKNWFSRNPWVIAAGITATATIVRGLLGN